MIDIEFPLTPSHLDKLIQIASFVDSKLPPPKKPICPTNFMLLTVTPENNKYKDTGGKMRIIPTARQMTIWQFTINLVARADFDSRELIKFKNLIISCDGGAASGKTTGAKLIAKKYGLKFFVYNKFELSTLF